MTYNENKECKVCKWIEKNFVCIGLLVCTFCLVWLVAFFIVAFLDIIKVINVF